ncbi:MAG: NAD(P)/FAD-dependent oxidoreductase [Candidatus Melainabacteria bacterium]|nr:NAD(P)/FAD-dependent oxidoreductase [Candidatus Melainabacteria bacterium]
MPSPGEENTNKNEPVAIIIGAGPAGLTAALELQRHSKIKPILLETTDYIGGLSRTVNHKGNRIDIGGHRFFSKSDRVMQWWLEIMPMQATQGEQLVTYRSATTTVNSSADPPDPEKTDRVMLIRSRKSRIYFMRKLFAYPISLSLQTLSNFGLVKTIKVGMSYMKATLFPVKPEKTLEEFLTNRFGKELYLTFFKSYTEKVWGVPCHKISAAWGAQRVKGLSLWKALFHFFRSLFNFGDSDVSQKKTETSLIEQFLYPKFGPGQMWECVADQVKGGGGEIHMETAVQNLLVDGNRIVGVEAKDKNSGETRVFTGDYFFSTMPMRDLVRGLRTEVPANIKEISEGLVYRDFITVGLLVKKMTLKEDQDANQRLVSDNWIYIQEPDVKLGRLQIFNNWSPYMVANPDKVWLGLEYFCDETEPIWTWDNETVAKFAGEELERIGMIDRADIEDWTVIHMPKTYPGYFGTYDRFDDLRRWIDRFENLFLVGRNGMHKYNNQDHSMLTAMVAVENIVNGVKSKDNLWEINTEEEYHENKKEPAAAASRSHS